MKACTRCGEIKPPGEFYKNPNMKDGLLRQCTSCVKAARATQRDANRGRIRAANRDYYIRNRDARIQKAAEAYAKNPHANHVAVERHRENHPVEARARYLAGIAIKTGKLRKQPCERCGHAINVQAHHEDYTKPLDVIWLCPPCHGARHREINEERRQRAA